MQRPLYYGILALAILVTAAAAAVGVTRYLSARLYAPPREPAGRSAAVTDRADDVPPPESWINVFSPSAGMKAPPKEESAAGGEAAPTGTVFALVGTIASDHADAARAILWAEGMKEPRMYRLRQEIEPGATLVRIERDAAWIQRGKVREKLELLPVGSRVRLAAAPASPGVAPPARSAATAAAAGTGTDIRVSKIGENTYSMDEASLSQLTGNFNQFMTQVRLIPYFEGNKNSGYRIAAIRPGTAFEKMGFTGGDVIQAINGIELSTPERMFTVFQNLKDEKRVSINVLRQGQKTTLTYEIR